MERRRRTGGRAARSSQGLSYSWRARLVDELDPVFDRHVGCHPEVLQAAYIGGRDDLGPRLLQSAELDASEAHGKLALQERISTRRTAAQMRIANRSERKPGGLKEWFNAVCKLLSVLQRARRLPGDAPTTSARAVTSNGSDVTHCEHLAQIARRLAISLHAAARTEAY